MLKKSYLLHPQLLVTEDTNLSFESGILAHSCSRTTTAAQQYELSVVILGTMVWTLFWVLTSHFLSLCQVIFVTKCHQSFPKPNPAIFVPKLIQNVIEPFLKPTTLFLSLNLTKGH